jgi:hypothetical protein
MCSRVRLPRISGSTWAPTQHFGCRSHVDSSRSGAGPICSVPDRNRATGQARPATAAAGCPIGALQAVVRVKVTWVTPLGEEVASTR